MKKFLFLTALLSIFVIPAQAFEIGDFEIEADVWAVYRMYNYDTPYIYANSRANDELVIDRVSLSLKKEIHEKLDGKIVLYYTDNYKDDGIIVDEVLLTIKNLEIEGLSFGVGKSYVPFGNENASLDRQRNTVIGTQEYWAKWLWTNMISANYKTENFSLDFAVFEAVDTNSIITSENKLYKNFAVKFEGIIPLPFAENALKGQISVGNSVTRAEKMTSSAGLTYTCPFIQGADASFEYLYVEDGNVNVNKNDKYYAFYAGYGWNSIKFAGRYVKRDSRNTKNYRFATTYHFDENIKLVGEFARNTMNEIDYNYSQLMLKVKF